MKMKTIIAAIAVATTAIASFGITVADLYDRMKGNKSEKERDAILASISTEEWRGVLDEFISIAPTNSRAYGTFAFCAVGRALARIPSAKSLAAEYDVKLANVGYYYPTSAFYKEIPRLVTNAENSPIESISYVKPEIELARKYPDSGERVIYDASLPELVNAKMRTMASKYSYSDVQQNRSFCMRRASKEIKRVMREQGVSFVSPDGKTNPVQVELDALSNALNAPKFAGLKEWFAKWYPSHQWVDATFMSDAEIKKLCDDIYYGDVQFTRQNKSTL